MANSVRVKSVFPVVLDRRGRVIKPRMDSFHAALTLELQVSIPQKHPHAAPSNDTPMCLGWCRSQDRTDRVQEVIRTLEYGDKTRHLRFETKTNKTEQMTKLKIKLSISLLHQ